MEAQTPAQIKIRRRRGENIAAMRDMLHLFGHVFEDIPTYCAAQPDDAYLRALLASDTFIALAASAGKTTVGGLTAYVWRKYEQARQEIYIYDLAVHEKWRRRGIASQLIENIKSIAQNMGAYSIIVQAHPEDHAAVALYRQSSTPENILTFDIEIAKTAPLK